MDYGSSLEYLYGLQKSGIKLGLENTRLLLERLNNPQRQLRIIHVAGTNGKGSTASALDGLLRAHGLRTGLYTSPHLSRFNQRIRIDQRPLSDGEIVRLTEEIRAAVAGISATFFEFTTVMALLAFQQQQVDYVILETGLGGRYDSTNVVEPVLTLLTPIALDHTAYLGHELAQIAAEKAAIIKPATRVISALQAPEVTAVLEKNAKVQSAPLWMAGRDFCWSGCAEQFDYQGPGLQLKGLRSGLAGDFQCENLSLALAALEALPSLTPDPCRCLTSLAQLRWPGRLEWCGRLLLDGAHNPHAAAALGRYLRQQGLESLRWVAAIKEDKDVCGLLQPILPQVAHIYLTRLPQEISTSVDSFRAGLHHWSGRLSDYEAPQQALQQALDDADPDEPILVAGSLYLVGALRQMALQQGG